MGGIEKGLNFILSLANKNGQKIDLNSFTGEGVTKNDMNKSVFEKFDLNSDGKIDKNEAKAMKAFLKNRAGDDNILSHKEIQQSGLWGNQKDQTAFFNALYDLYTQQASNDAAAEQTPANTPAAQSSTPAPASVSTQPVEIPAEEPKVEETPQPSVETPAEEPQENQNKTYNYEVNYKDTWYGIVQAKYGITDHKQTMEIVRQLKAQNNVDPKATNMPSNITLPENVTLKDGTEVKMADIDAAVDQSHWGYKTTSETGRYTITQNGKTRYYAADGTELKQSYYEAKEASEDKRQMAESGSGRYSYTAENGETWYFAADGTAIKKEYYERRESEYTAVNAQKETLSNARDAFEQQKASDGWAGKTADAVSVLWNSDNRAVKVEEDLQTYETQIKELQQAQSKGAAEFSAKFKEIYGVDYNPANIAAYEQNPTEENYKKAYGTKNDIHKRVMDYNKSQQEGAAAVKTTVVAGATVAAAVATGGTSLAATAAIAGATGGASLAATAAIAGASTMAARTAVEVSDLATNAIDGDVNSENLNNIAKEAMVEGAISAVTAGAVKGAAGMLGKAAPKAAPKATSETGLARVQPKGTSSVANTEKMPVKGSAGGTGSTGGTGATGGTGSTSSAGASASSKGASGSAQGASSSAENAGARGASAAEDTAKAASASTGSSSNLTFVKSMSSKIANRGGLSNLSSAEKSQLSNLIGKSVDDIAQMPKTEFRQLLLKFHPDKNPGNEEFCQEVFSMINNLRVAA